MISHYDPFEDCLGPRPNNKISIEYTPPNPSTAWIIEAVQIIVGLAYAYDTLKNGGANVDKLLIDIGKKLDEIKDQIIQVNKGIDRIIDLLIDMPRIVRGEVEAAQLEMRMGEIYQINLLIKDSVQKKYLLRDQVKLEGYLAQLRISLGGVLGLKGVSGILVVAPYIAVWLSASVALEKALKEKDPNYEVRSPWESEFMGDMKSLFSDLFFQAEALDYEFNKKTIPSFPKHQIILEVNQGKFQKAHDFSLQLYRVTCPDGNNVERLEYGDRTGIPPLPGKPPKPPGTPEKINWHIVQSGDALHQKALSAYDKFLKERAAVVAFYNWVPKLDEKKIELLTVFDEPPNYW